MKFYTVTAAGSGCNLGRVAEAKTMKVAKVIGRLAVTHSLPNGQGAYRVRNNTCQIVAAEERSERTAFKWVTTHGDE